MASILALPTAFVCLRRRRRHGGGKQQGGGVAAFIPALSFAGSEIRRPRRSYQIGDQRHADVRSDFSSGIRICQ